MSKYEKFSKEELIALAEKQDSELASKKYGLVWDAEREPEQVVLDCANNLPVLKRAKGKEIRTNDGEDNVLIEGDNYHALTVLNYTHKEKIDVIYIDPPYNTGNQDFKYNDRFVDKTDGFRHSKWLNFMAKRLVLAYDLLKETGVIFISIDENELYQLKLLSDKIFSEGNFIANLIWKSKSGGANDSRFFAVDHEYVLVYAKNSSVFKLAIDLKAEVTTVYNLEDKNGQYGLDRLDKQSIRYAKSLDYEIIGPDGKSYLPKHKDLKNPNASWRWGKNTVQERYKELVFKNGSIYTKNYKKEGSIPRSLLIEERFGRTRTGKTELFDLFGKEIFQNPKPSKLIRHLIGLVQGKEIKVLDFFAGSGTTGHAVLELNKEDGGNRKFILCTNNEEIDNNGNSKKHKICTDVTYPRLEKIINGYKKNGNGEKVDGLGGNLQYFTTALMKGTKNKDQLRLDLTRKCTEMLCVRENIFNLEIEKEDYKIFSSNKGNEFLCVYYNLFDTSRADFLKDVKKLKGKKKVYMFSDDGRVDRKPFIGAKDCDVEEIPQKIIEVYQYLVKMNIPVKSEIIFLELEKAQKKIFEDGEKDEGARILRIVLEKTIQKIAQKNSISIFNSKLKEEKIAILNDKLKESKVFNQVVWEENKTYLTIGNNASHGDYNQYEIKHVENFYRYIQSLLSDFGI
ncbi:MAG: site-specific DNA-methyltransferase [Candidatus Magasanikbacteria bacterium]